jgi:glycosyltransferase involved in cell wall biosynthesis
MSSFFKTETENIPNSNDAINNVKNIKLVLPPITDEELPSVSIVTPTYNRSKFIKLMIRNWTSIDYPSEKLEWIIVDDSDIPGEFDLLKKQIEDLSDPRIHLHRINFHMKLGLKRNFCCRISKHSYIVHMDSDDFYPSTSVVARIRVLLNFEKKSKSIQSNSPDIVGCQTVNCYDILEDKTFEAHDYGILSISESTLAYNSNYWSSRKFNNEDVSLEGPYFIRNSRVCTMPSTLVVTQLTHNSNTILRKSKTFVDIDGYKFLENVVAFDANIINEIKAAILLDDPVWKKAVYIVKKGMDLNIKDLRVLFEKLSEDLKMNQMIQNFIRSTLYYQQKSSGKEIVYYCGPGSHFKFTKSWNPMSETLGGSEEAVIHLSSYLSKKGYSVTVYCVLPENKELDYDGVKYRNYYNWLPLDQKDITILWRDPSLCDVAIKSDKIFLDLHDAIDTKWLMESEQITSKKVTLMFKSKFHKNLLDPLGKFKSRVIPNGVTTDYKVKLIRERDPKNIKLICTSSPDRCLSGLIEVTKKLAENLKEYSINVYWAYGFKNGINEGGLEADTRPDVREWISRMKDSIKNIEVIGFHDLGSLTQSEIINLYKDADYFIYGTTFQEIDCISMTKAVCCGSIPIVTPCAALEEKLVFLGIDDFNIVEDSDQDSDTDQKTITFDRSVSGKDLEKFISSAIEVIKSNNYGTEERLKMAEKMYSRYNWGNIVGMWSSLF